MADKGFRRLKIFIPANGDKPAQSFVVEGITNKGATNTVDITGLSKDATTVAGSDGVYYISREGVGEAKAAFGLLDLPHEVESAILGKEVDADGLTYVGEKTEAPYCSLVIEDTDLAGNKGEIGLFRGTFSKDTAKSIKTLDPKGTFTPEAEAYTYTMARAEVGDDAGRYEVEYYGKNDDEAFAKLEAKVLTAAFTPGEVSDPKA